MTTMAMKKTATETATRWAALALVLASALALPSVIRTQYYLHLVTMSLIWLIMTQGLNIIQGYTGYVSITQAGLFGVGAYTSALLTIRAGLSFWAALPLSAVVAGLLGLIIGYPALKTRGHYFAIKTLAFNMVIWLILMVWYQFTGGEAGLMVARPEPITLPLLGQVAFRGRPPYYYLTLVLALLATALVHRLVKSRTGRALIAIRENEQLAQAVGINPLRYKMTAFALSAVFAGVAGSLYAHYINFINPTPFGIDTSLNAILVVILGGSGTILGPVLGSFLLVFLPEYLRVADAYRLVIYGLALILITIYMPRGIVGTLGALWAQRKIAHRGLVRRA